MSEVIVKTDGKGESKKLQTAAWLASITSALIALVILLIGSNLLNHSAHKLDPPIKPALQTNAVTILLPSTYNDADIFVDGQLAEITGRTLSSVTLRVVAPPGPHLFRFKKGSVVRELNQSLPASQPLTPFAN